MSTRTTASEAEISRAIMEYLAASHIMAFRMNTGTMTSEYKGKTRFMRFGVPGMADILAFPGGVLKGKYTMILWIEVKSTIGKQSDLQKSFQEQVEREGHRYVLARSIEDVAEALR